MVPTLPTLALSMCLAGLSLVPLERVDGQTVQGRVFDAANDQRIANALLRLVDRSGQVRAALAADTTGSYALGVPEPGTYRLRAERLGYEPFESEPFEVQDTTDALRVDLPMRPSPIPVRGVDVSTDVVNRRIRDFLGANPAQLRIRPIRAATIRDHAMRGSTLSEMIRWRQIPNLQVLPTRDGPCYQFRGRGCLPVHLDGARLSRAPNALLPLEMLSAVVVLLPNELIAYPSGAVHLFTAGFMR